MSANEADRSAKQFNQSMSETPASGRIDTQRSQTSQLREHYKPVGISAVSAAAHFTSKAKKKTQQMS